MIDYVFSVEHNPKKNVFAQSSSKNLFMTHFSIDPLMPFGEWLLEFVHNFGKKSAVHKIRFEGGTSLHFPNVSELDTIPNKLIFSVESRSENF